VLKATLKLDIHCPWASYLAGGGDKISKSSITILQCIPYYDSKGTSAVVRVFTKRFNARSLARAVKRVKEVKEASFVAVKPNTYLGIIKTLECPCAKISLPHFNLLSVKYGDDGKLYWTFLLSGRDELYTLLKHLDARNVEYTIHEVVKVSDAWALSEKQTIVLEKALKLGLYDNPRRITLTGLSNELNISPKAVSEILRRAHRKLVIQAVEAEHLNNGF